MSLHLEYRVSYMMSLMLIIRLGVLRMEIKLFLF